MVASKRAADKPRVVVCALRGERGAYDLPSSSVDPDLHLINGGERSLYEIAVAAAALGYEVELRGGLNGPILDRLTEAAGVGPATGLAPRPPEQGEIVVVPEGMGDLSVYTAVHLSGAIGVMAMLAPPGLFGWDFRAGWERPDPSTVALEAVGAPGTFRAVDALGFSVWTNADGIAEAGRSAGVEVTSIGSGTPVAFPPPAAKRFDVAVIEENRWHADAAAAAGRLMGASVLRVGRLEDSYWLCDALAPARLLLWPSRIEGRSRIAREARAVGTVPVALSTNPFVTPDDHSEGVVLCRDLDEIVATATRLLADPALVAELAASGAESARRQTDWPTFVGRVGDALAALAPRHDTEARAHLGALLRSADEERYRLVDDEREALRARGDELAVHAGRLEDEVAATRQHADNLQGILEHERAAAAATAARLRELEAELDATATERDALGARVAALEAELDAMSQRRIVRLVDHSPLRRAARPPQRGG